MNTCNTTPAIAPPDPSRRVRARLGLFVVGAALATLASCGGGSSSADADNAAKVLSLRAQAEGKQLEARALGQDSPCITAAQCKALVFSVISGNCPAVTYHAYSSLTLSAAQAEAAALEQRNLAQQANAILAPSLVCPAIAPAPAVLICNANKCALGT